MYELPCKQAGALRKRREYMTAERIVIALGGNALQPPGGQATADAQLQTVRKTCEHIARISGMGYEIAVVHGNGPQVGRIVMASEAADTVTPAMPFDVCGAMSQGYIGYHIQQSLKYALNRDNRNVPVVTVATQVIVDEKDPAFKSPSKPIGPFYTREEAERLERDRGYIMKEDAGRGYRRVVPSPLPKRIVEIEAVKQLWDRSIVITCGGGGIPVIEKPDGHLEGVAAVIDKDHAAELLAENVEADILMILTGVEKVCLDFGRKEERALSRMSLKECARYVEEGHFPEGSMLPKVEAAMKFIRLYPDKKAVITSLDKAVEALAGKTGTVVTFN